MSPQLSFSLIQMLWAVVMAMPLSWACAAGDCPSAVASCVKAHGAGGRRSCPWPSQTRSRCTALLCLVSVWQCLPGQATPLREGSLRAFVQKYVNLCQVPGYHLPELWNDLLMAINTVRSSRHRISQSHGIGTNHTVIIFNDIYSEGLRLFLQQHRI